jgi:hypothetical protein
VTLTVARKETHERCKDNRDVRDGHKSESPGLGPPAIYKDEHGNIVNSLLLARTPDGTILRKTDLVLDWWEKPAEETDPRFLQ